MGNFLIKVNDVLMGLFVVILIILGTIGAPLIGTVLAIILGAIVGGTWYVLSGIYWNTKRIAEQLEKKG